MKIKKLPLGLFPLLFLLAIFSLSCSRVQQVKDAISKPSAREKYARNFKENAPEFLRWVEVAKKAVLDSVIIELPYSEAGKFHSGTYPVYSYELTLDQGEQLQVGVQTDSADAVVFIDLYEKKRDSIRSFELLTSADFGSHTLETEITKPGVYKLLIQPEIVVNTTFRLNIFKEPVYHFPVASTGNSAVQSFWGASRDAGRRRHEGIDIFAPRGTPVLAAAAGRVSSTANKGLGGKQVWLRDRKRGNSLYYAHLDSIIASPGMRVSPGDTLGLVGNSGNARTTPPHLHFGIYKGFRGAVNPLPYVHQTEKPENISFRAQSDSKFLKSTATANLRKGPTTNAEIVQQVQPRDTLELLGKTRRWFHIRLDGQNVFIHESLAEPL